MDRGLAGRINLGPCLAPWRFGPLLGVTVFAGSIQKVGTAKLEHYHDGISLWLVLAFSVFFMFDIGDFVALVS